MLALLLTLTLSIDPAALRTAPGVNSVEVTGPANPTRTIIHICDWHYVRPGPFIEAARDENGKAPPVKEAADAYRQHLVDVSLVQAQQKKLVQHLIEKHKIRTFHLEGFTPRTIPIMRAMVDLIGKQAREPANEDEFVLRLKAGAVGQIAATTKLRLLPAEDEAARRTGPTDTSTKAVQARDKAIVRNLLALKEKTVVVVLGVAHDLRKVLPAGVQYVRVRVRRTPNL